MAKIGEMIREYRVVSCEIQRKKRIKTKDWNKTVGPAIPIDTIDVGSILTLNKEKIEQ